MNEGPHRRNDSGPAGAPVRACARADFPFDYDYNVGDNSH